MKKMRTGKMRAAILAGVMVLTLLKVYSMIKKGITSEINALTTLVLAVFVIFLVMWLIYMAVKSARVKKARRAYAAEIALTSEKQ